MFLYWDHLQENITKLMSNRVTKQPNFWEMYSYPNCKGAPV